MAIDKVIKYLELNSDGILKEKEKLSDHCSIRVGGVAAAIFYPENVEDVISAIKKCKEQDVDFKIIGRGSNIIFPDGILECLLIKISNNGDELSFVGDELISVDAAYSLQKLSKVLSKKGYKGLEFAGGIPGTLGGAIYMNAGAHTGEIQDIIYEVTCLDENLNIIKLSKDDCDFKYRKSIFQKENYVILSAVLKMEKGDNAEIFKKMSGNLEYRKEMQPLNWPSFGSVFKNPENNHAGKVIDELGLKGYTIGGAQVSLKHANFIINNGGATSKDVKDLINYIKTKAYEEKGIELFTEVEIIEENYERKI